MVMKDPSLHGSRSHSVDRQFLRHDLDGLGSIDGMNALHHQINDLLFTSAAQVLILPDDDFVKHLSGPVRRARRYPRRGGRRHRR